jgi:hypothetical protein
MMKRYLLVFLLPFLLYACTVSDPWNDDFRMEESQTKTYSSSQIEVVKVETQNGSIESTVWNDDSIHVVFDKWATGHDIEDAEDNVDEIKIRTSRNSASGTLIIDVDFPPNFFGESYGCDVSLNLPASLALDLESSNGSIAVWETQGDIECHTSNGSITLQNTEGHAELTTSNGRIDVENHYGELNGRTSNGAVDADIVLPRQGECVLKTSNGAINLAIPDSASAMMEASTSNGKVEVSGLPVSIIKMEKTEFRGKLGGGQGNIDLKTSNGTIRIRGAR